MDVDPYELGLAVAGFAALLAAWLPGALDRRPLSMPMLLLIVGALVGLAPTGLPPADPRPHLEIVERVTELVVIVALMGAGLKIDRRFSWRGWSSTWRLLGIAMPLTIAGVAVLGTSVAGLALAEAVLLGAVLAPTDPVLATDVQVGEPTVGDDAAAEEIDRDEAEDEVRFALTSEGGLNDALAFPFVYLAIALVEHPGGGRAGALAEWVAWDLVGRIAVALAVGVAVGWLLARVAFRPPSSLRALSRTPQGFAAVAATLLAYGTTDLLSGYGFLAVFVAAVVLRSAEPHHALHAELHGFVAQTENLLVVGLLLLVGAALTTGLLDGLGAVEVGVAAALVLVVRPAVGLVSLVRSPLPRAERLAVAFFGVRGVGSVYYLAYGLTAAPFVDGDVLWRIVACALALSIALHGLTATPAMAGLDRLARRRHGTARAAAAAGRPPAVALGGSGPREGG